MRFIDRRDAGRLLAPYVTALELHDPVVLGLPRGGVIVAAPVAEALNARLEVFVARKVGLPEQPEFGIGAIAEGLDEPITYAGAPRIRERTWRELTAAARAELDRRVAHYRPDRGLPPLEGADVVVVDDGLATGVTAEAALTALHAYAPPATGAGRAGVRTRHRRATGAAGRRPGVCADAGSLRRGRALVRELPADHRRRGARRPGRGRRRAVSR